MAFGLVKHNNNSISAITSAGNLTQGKMTLLQTQTASSSASISFTSNIDSTYPIYLFKFINIHPATDGANLTFQGNAVGESGYNETITSTYVNAYHTEADASALQYFTGGDQAQGTGFNMALSFIGNDNDQSGCGFMHLFNPSSTTFVKHFIINGHIYYNSDGANHNLIAGYFNTTSAIDEIQFKMSSGNIDSGTIKLYGIKGS
tara:strand:+ start:384 stop:995 length:612 start_codon:yes stop_codon:yes gene_type:complete